MTVYINAAGLSSILARAGFSFPGKRNNRCPRNYRVRCSRSDGFFPWRLKGKEILVAHFRSHNLRRRFNYSFWLKQSLACSDRCFPYFRRNGLFRSHNLHVGNRKSSYARKGYWICFGRSLGTFRRRHWARNCRVTSVIPKGRVQFIIADSVFSHR